MPADLLKHAAEKLRAELPGWATTRPFVVDTAPWLRIYVEPRDIWVGVFVAPAAVYVCPLPMVVIKFTRSVRT